MRLRLTISLLIILYAVIGHTQTPMPCGAVPTMAPTCLTACVICDIDGYTGTNNLQSDDGGFPEFCSNPDNVHYIAFIAGSSEISIRIDLSNCSSGFSALDIGFYESLDCQDYTPITNCYDNLENGEFTVFNTQNLNVGQHYYLVMDGSAGAVCDWTFTVLNGSTEVSSLGTSEEPQVPDLICANQEFTIAITPQVEASIYRWFLDGDLIDINPQFDYTIQQAGTYNLCFQESNPCDEADQVCRLITVQPQVQHDTTLVICEGDSIQYNGITYFDAGSYNNILIPADQGCDTLANLTLDYGAIFEGDDEYFICDGDTLSINGQLHYEAGIYDHFLLTEKGCDSVVHVYLNLVICNMEGIAEAEDLLCFGDGEAGSFSFQITAGTPPFNYSWVKVFEEDVYFDSGSLASDFEDVVVNNIPAGTYIITVDDGFGNFTIISTEVFEPDQIASEMQAIDYNGFNVSCFDGSDGEISVTATGGIPPYQYTWSNGEAGSPSISQIPSGAYYVTITDFNNCNHIDTIFLIQPGQLTFNTTPVDPNCDGPNTGTIEIVQPSGGVGPYSYSFDGGAYNQTTLHSSLLEASYTSIVQDDNGCTSTITDTLIAAEIPEVDFDDDFTISLGDSVLLQPLVNDIAIGNIDWSNDEYLSCDNCLMPFAFPINTTSFNILVTSDDDCSDEASITVRVNKNRDIFAPNIFSPSASGEDQTFSVLGGAQISKILSLTIFDRWGNVVFEATNLDKNTTAQGWAGTIDGQEASPAVYVWVAEVEYLDFHTEKHVGDIMLAK